MTGVQTCALPISAASPAAGAIASGTAVTLSTATAGAKVLYTLDGTAPSMSSPEFKDPIVITAAVTIKAIAIKEGMDPSSVLTAAYTIA